MAELTDIARAIATNHGLDPALICAVCEQESGWQPWAIRFEPAFYTRYVEPQNLAPTEAYARSFSWGLMQIMGQVAREQGFDGRFLAELCDPSTGVEYGCRKLARCLAKAGGDVSQALQFYNGGGNPNYASQVVNRMSKY